MCTMLTAISLGKFYVLPRNEMIMSSTNWRKFCLGLDVLECPMWNSRHQHIYSSFSVFGLAAKLFIIGTYIALFRACQFSLILLQLHNIKVVYIFYEYELQLVCTFHCFKLEHWWPRSGSPMLYDLLNCGNCVTKSPCIQLCYHWIVRDSDETDIASMVQI